MTPLFIFFNSIPYPILLAFLIFLLLILLPFVPAIRELVRPKDSLALFIKMDYTKNPRYFDRAFKDILEKSLEKVGYEPGLKKVQLSKNELVDISDSKVVPDNEIVGNILYVRKKFTSGKRVYLNKEIFAGESAIIGEKNVLRAVASDGNITISAGTRVIRWVGTEGSVFVGSDCVLGKLCSCSGLLEIGKACVFNALYGKPINTYKMPDKEVVSVAPKMKNVDDAAWYVSENHFSIPPGAVINNDIISKRNLTLKKDCTVAGSLKSYGNIVLDEGVTVKGNLFAEGDIIIGGKSTVTGNIFSQSYIRIAGNVRVGETGTIKSVIGKKGIELTGNTVIFGYVLTEGTGRVL
ncbi:MAG: hypothetical protein WC081_06215 [Candidatus Ratteibacteria bacterium]